MKTPFHLWQERGATLFSAISPRRLQWHAVRKWHLRLPLPCPAGESGFFPGVLWVWTKPGGAELLSLLPSSLWASFSGLGSVEEVMSWVLLKHSPHYSSGGVARLSNNHRRRLLPELGPAPGTQFMMQQSCSCFWQITICSWARPSEMQGAK